MNIDFATLQAFMAEHGLEPSADDIPPALDRAKLEATIAAAQGQYGEVFSMWLERMTREDRGARRFACVSWRQARMGWKVASDGADAQKKLRVKTDFDEYYKAEEEVEYLHPRVTPDGQRVFVKQMLPKSVAEHMTKEAVREAREREWKQAQALVSNPQAFALIKILDSSLPDAERLEAAKDLLAQLDAQAASGVTSAKTGPSRATHGSKNSALVNVVIPPEVCEALRAVVGGAKSLDEFAVEAQGAKPVGKKDDNTSIAASMLMVLDTGLRRAKTPEDTTAAIEIARQSGLLGEQVLVDAVASTARIVDANTGVWVMETADVRAVLLFAQKCKISQDAIAAVADACIRKCSEASGAAMVYADVLLTLVDRGIIGPGSAAWQTLVDSCSSGTPIPGQIAIQILLMSPAADEALLLSLAEQVVGTPLAALVAEHKNATMAVWRIVTSGECGLSVWRALASKSSARQDPQIAERLAAQNADAIVAAYLLVDRPIDEFLDGFAKVAAMDKGPKALTLSLGQASTEYLGQLTPELLEPLIFDRDVAVRTYAQQIILAGVPDERYHEVMKVAPARPDFPKRDKASHSRTA